MPRHSPAAWDDAGSSAGGPIARRTPLRAARYAGQAARPRLARRTQLGRNMPATLRLTHMRLQRGVSIPGLLPLPRADALARRPGGDLRTSIEPRQGKPPASSRPDAAGAGTGAFRPVATTGRWRPLVLERDFPVPTVGRRGRIRFACGGGPPRSSAVFAVQPPGVRRASAAPLCKRTGARLQQSDICRATRRRISATAVPAQSANRQRGRPGAHCTKRARCVV